MGRVEIAAPEGSETVNLSIERAELAENAIFRTGPLHALSTVPYVFQGHGAITKT